MRYVSAWFRGRGVLGGLALLAATHVEARPLTPRQLSAIDAAANKALADTGVPAVSIAIVQGGKIVYARAYGFQRPAQPARTTARYPIGSVSKQFTAAAVLMLADEGRLSLDDRIARYLPGLTRADAITVRQILAHTAGYRDYWPQDYIFEDMTRPVSPAAILDRWAKAPLDFEPGTRWQYSNTGYTAAGRIVETLSGQGLFTFLRRRVFDRLGMTPVEADTGLTPADPLGHQRFVLGPVRVATPTAPGWTYATGSLAMTASDLARWDISVIDRSLMTPAAYAAQQREVVLQNGLGTRYGLGVFVDAVRGHRRIAHGGGAAGFLAENRIYPDDHAAIVVLDNADFSDAQTVIADAIEEQIFAEDSGVARARSLYDQFRSGRIDRDHLTTNGNYYFTAAVLDDYRTSLSRLGEPSSVVQVQSGLRGGFTIERYRLGFGDRALLLTLRCEPGQAGRIEEFFLEPTS